MNITRRDLLKFAAGSAAGVFLTPIPWKLLDDSAIWTQNWSWIPKPATGEVQHRFTTCTLCPAGCGLRARCIAGHPVSLSGTVGHPLGNGTLCAIGLGGHHLAYHPARVLQPLIRSQKFGTVESSPASLDDCVTTISNAIRASSTPGSVAILDQRPGRVISSLYMEFLSGIPGGIYITPPRVEDASLRAAARMLSKPAASFGYDLENAKMIVSFGAPLFDGWGTPGRMMQLLRNKPALVQIESRLSRTAAIADQWVPLRPGTEVALALSLAHVLVEEKLYDAAFVRANAVDFEKPEGSSYRSLLARFAPETTAAITGIPAEKVRSIARQMATGGPAVVIGGGDPGGGPLGNEEEMALAGLNFLLGQINRPGGLVARSVTPAAKMQATDLENVPDHSIHVLVLDGAESGNAIPWPLIERKLADERALVVSMSQFMAGHAKRAGIVLPSPAFLESWDDVPVPFDASRDSFAVSAPLIPAPANVVEPVLFLEKLAAGTGTAFARGASGPNLMEDLKVRAGGVFKKGNGTLFTAADKGSVPVQGLSSEDAFWTALSEGGCWIDGETRRTDTLRFTFLSESGYQRMLAVSEGRTRIKAARFTQLPLVVMPFGWRGTTGNAQFSPLMTKLYQESGLRDSSNQAFVSPKTAEETGLKNGGIAVIETAAGKIETPVRVDHGVMPGVIFVAVGPDPDGLHAKPSNAQNSILTICTQEGDATWRATQAKAWGA